MKIDEDIVLIAGPTASGKTGLAIEIASANNGIIINADSMQVYEDLRLVTARPSVEEETAAPHFLFGHRKGVHAYSVAQWLGDVTSVLQAKRNEGRQIIFVGGTGLYFNALTMGLSPMPDIDPDVREKWRSATNQSAEELHEQLKSLDRAAAHELRRSDRQRIIRALEVYESTGKSILLWQEQEGDPLIGQKIRTKRLLLMPERGHLHTRINYRFDLMIEEGAVEEVRTLVAKNLDRTLPVMKAIGVPQLSAYLAGEVSLDDAREKAKAASRQYAKRQITWFRNSLGNGWKTI